MTLLLWAETSLGLSSCLIVMQVMAVSMLIFLVLYRPYVGKMDTVGSIGNILLQLSFLLMITMRNEGVIPRSYDTDVILCFVITLFCTCCFVFSVVRLILTACLSKSIPVQEEKFTVSTIQGARQGLTKRHLMKKVSSSMAANNLEMKESLIDEEKREGQREFKMEKEIDL